MRLIGFASAMRIEAFLIGSLGIPLLGQSQGLEKGGLGGLFGGERPAREVACARIKRGPLVVEVVEEGELRASKAQVIVAPFDGKITKLLPEGTSVAAGDPVFWMSTEELEEVIEEREVDVERTRAVHDKAVENAKLAAIQDEMSVKAKTAELEYARVKLEDAKRQAEKARILVQNKLAPRSSLEDAELKVTSAELSLKNAEIALEKANSNKVSNEKIQRAEVRAAEVDLERAKRQLAESQEEMSKAVVKTQLPGMIVHKKTWRGGGFGKLQEGDQVYRSQEVLELPDFSGVEALLFVNEVDVSDVKEGQVARVTLHGIPDATFEGKVTRIAALAQDLGQSKDFFRRGPVEGQGVNVFEVHVTLNEKDARMRQGMTARVEIEVAREENALLAPLEAVFEEGEGQYVAYLKRGEEIHGVPVAVGLISDEWVEVTGGLKEGDVVCLRKPLERAPEAKRP